jgi:SAM-dependent methyltransferase
MNKRMSENIWDVDFDITKLMMDRRIRICTLHFGWQHAIRVILGKGTPFHKLKIAEVGCGTGTTSLAFCLLGTSVTLLDFNQRVLKNARDIYKLYDCKAELVLADCMDTPVDELRGKFDFVVSSGLAEHFIGDDRERCILYHKLLLKNGGFAYIDVPNKLSPFYQWIKEFRKLTGTWNLEIEVPFTPRELKTLAIKIGFKNACVIGSAPLQTDFIDYSRGFGSAVKELFPFTVQEMLRARKEKKMTRSDASDDMRQYCRDMVNAISRGYFKKPRSLLVNTFSAGLILFAFD